MELGRWRRFAYAIISVMMLLHFNTCLSMSHHHANVTRCTERERDALLAIKADLIDENNQLSSWGTQEDCCGWESVYCDDMTGHVTQLHLGAPQMWVSFLRGMYLHQRSPVFIPFKGKLSPKIIELEHLEYLDLSYNGFNKSQVPALICSLSNLQHLDLSNNEISGSRIPELIGNLTNLRYLDLSGNSLGDAFLYHQLGNLTHLHYLNLGHNGLTHGVGLLKTVSHLSSLKYLDLSRSDLNKASSWVQSITNLPNLRNLTLSSCDLPPPILPAHSHINSSYSLVSVDLSNNPAIGSSIFKWLCNYNTTLAYFIGDTSNDFTHPIEFFSWLPCLSSLEYLDLSSSNLSSVFDWPRTLNKLPHLRDLRLRQCQLPSPIVSSTLSDKNTSHSLAYVDLSYNNLTSMVFKWLSTYNTSTLDYLDLSNNTLSGSLPNVFGSMSSLTYLDLSRNQLEGMIPDSISRLCSLRHLDISSNKLNGSLPDVFGCMSSLGHLSLTQNQLEGMIPSSFAKLCSLRDLDVSWNNLNAHFSSFIESSCAQDSLRLLHLAGNKLTGTIPKSIGNMSKLENIDLGDNNLEGVISETHFSKLSKLEYLDLSRNNLVLHFHSEWAPPFQLYELYLSTCKMGPSFPQWLRTQKNLGKLAISDAGISDIIPSWFWDWSRDMSSLELSSSEIKGTLPDSGFESALLSTQVNLSWNQMECTIPSFFSEASYLDLSHNKFTKLDSFLCSSNASDLVYLDLSSNHISGELPDCWAHLWNLDVLDLSNNNISGNIPFTMGSLSSIKTLKLADNMFVGELPSSLKNCTQLIAVDFENNTLSGPIPRWLGVEVSSLKILILRSNHFNGSLPSQLCSLTSIQVLDLSMNNISGNIPKCLKNLIAMAQKGNTELTISYDLPYNQGIPTVVLGNYIEEISIIWKAVPSKYKSTLGLVKSIDFSSNRLTGEIPVEITQLVELVSLILAGNHLTGQISPEIGKLKSLQSLDLSRNKISGPIPPSLLQIYGMGYLNLSYNNLSGKIPVGPQIQSYEASSFAGNPQLCGIPLPACDPVETDQPNAPSVEEDPDDELISQGFYISLGLGFAIGFWGVCGSLMFKRSWRYSYYNFLNASSDRLYVRVALIKRRLKDMYGRQL